MKDAKEKDQKKNYISDFFDIYFSNYGYFCTQNCQFSMNSHDNSKNKIRKINFSFDSALCASFMKMGAKLRGGGLRILSWKISKNLNTKN